MVEKLNKKPDEVLEWERAETCGAFRFITTNGSLFIKSTARRKATIYKVANYQSYTASEVVTAADLGKDFVEGITKLYREQGLKINR